MSVKHAMTSVQEKWSQKGYPKLKIGHVNLEFSLSWISPVPVDGGASASIVSTPAYHPLKVLKDSAASITPRKPKLNLTRPKKPDIETAHRIHSFREKSTAELEEEMMANIPKFKTRPINKLAYVALGSFVHP